MGGVPVEVSKALGSWARRMRADARRDGWREICELHGYSEEDAAEIGPTLVEQLVEAVTWVLVTRFIDIAGTPSEIAEALVFLADQSYGLPDEARGARYSIRFMGSLVEVEIFVRKLTDLDLEDFESRFCLEAIAFRSLGGPLGEDEAADIVQAVYADLTFDGDEWEIGAELTERELVLEVREGEWEGEE